MNDTFDTEFKLYLHNKGITIDSNIFDVKFSPPQNFASYRQAEMDTARVSTYTSLAEVPYLSKRFSLKRFLGLSQEEITENEKLWQEENVDADTTLPANAELRGVGVTANGMGADMSALNGATAEPLPGEEDGSEAAPAGGSGATTPPPA
jgi:hypothetical protein